VDDLRPIGAVFGEPEAKMPNLDALAKSSTSFVNSWVQAATCGVSRSSLLTGRRPDTTRVLSNGGCPFTNEPQHKAWQSLPEYFAQNGYVTAGMGKIFHPNIWCALVVVVVLLLLVVVDAAVNTAAAAAETAVAPSQ